jgi:poly(glycerol-phosphate) alpha-glucosyltransferase
VYFAGPLFLEAKHAAFCHANAFVIASTSEGMPTAVLEAWAYDLPVLMTPECNLPEAFASNAALRIETGPASIEQGLRDLFAMSLDETTGLARRGRALVEEKFSWPRIAAQMLEIYQWILGAGPRPSSVRAE